MKKTSTVIMLVILCSSMFCVLSATIPRVEAATAQVYVDPPSQTVSNIGDSFTVNVNISNVANLYGYSFKLYYDSTVMNGTQATEGSFLKSGGSTVFLLVSFNDQYNSTYGVVSISDFLTGNVPGVSGSGVLATVKFKAIAPADSVPLQLADVTLVNASPPPPSIAETSSDGTVTVAAVDSWPMFHRELTHTGFSTSTAPNTNQTLWTYTTNAPVISSPTVAGGILYVGSDKVYALNASTGFSIWNYTTGSHFQSSPAVTGGMVYVGSDDYNVTALNASSGAWIWNYTTLGPVFSSPAVANGKVFVGSEDGRVYALDAVTGAQIWNYTTGSSVRSSPAYDEEEGVVFVGSYDGNVTALDPSSGAYLRNYTTGASVFSSPAVANGMVFVGSDNGNVTALIAYSRALAWSFATGSPAVESSPAVAGGRVFVGSNNSRVYAFGPFPLIASILPPSPPPLDVGQSQLFTSSVTGGVSSYTYQWCLNGAPVTGATTATWTFTPNSSGLYSVYLNVTDSIGVKAQSNIALVTVGGALSVSVSPVTVTMDVGQSQTFTSSVSSGSPPYSYQWYDNGTIVSGAQNRDWTFTPSSSGSYSIYVNVTDYVGVIAVSNTATVTVNSALSVSVSPATFTMSLGQSKMFTSSVSGGTSPYSYRWYLNGIAVSGATSATWTFTPSFVGSYTVLVKVNDALGAQAPSNTATVTVVTPDWWPMFHHDLTHTGFSTSTAPNTNQTLWTYTTGSAVYSSPAVTGGMVYVGSDKVYALNASSGAFVWSYATGSYVRSSPAVASGVVYVGSNKVYALNALTGALIWSYTAGASVYSSPAVADGRVYVGSSDGKVYALDASTGALVWSYTTGASVVSSPVVAGGVVFVGSEDDRVYALNEMSGTQIWNYTTGNLVDSSPVVAGGMVFVGSYDGKVYALNATNGASVWNYTTGSWVFSSPAVAGGMVFVGSYDGKVYALNETTGFQIWNYTTGSYVVSSPAVASGVVFVGSYDYDVYALNATNGASVWNYTTGSWVVSSPAVAGGVVYVSSYDGNVYAFGVVPVSASILPSSAVLDVGQSQLFTSSVTGGVSPYTYQWYLNSSAVSGATGTTWTFTPSSSSSYSVYLNVTDNIGLNAVSNNVSVTVSGAISVSVSPSATFTMDVGQSQTFTSAVSGGISPYTFQWYLNGTAVSGATSASWVFAPASSGFYTVYVNATDNGGLKAKSNIASATVNPALSVSVSPTSVAMGVGQSQTFTSSVSGGTSLYTYQWYLSGLPVSGATSATWTFTPSSAGSYTVYVKVSDSVGGQATSNTATATVTLVAVDWWPMFHHDLTHTGNSSSTALNTNQTLWTYPTSSAVYSSPAVTGGIAYVGSDKVYALNAFTGAFIWSYTTGGQVYSSPAVAGGIVYVGSDKVYALNASTGALVWSYTTGGQVYSSPAVAGSMVYVGSYDGNVTALGASTGASVWNYTTGSSVYSSPAVADGRVYVGSLAGNVTALDASTGAFIWNYTTGASVYSSPAVAGGIVYVGSYDGNVYALNETTGTQIWNYTTGSPVDSSPAVAGGRVYVGSDKVYGLDASTGVFVWSYMAGSSVGSSPAVVGGVVFVGSNDYKVYAFAQLPLSVSISPSSAVLDVGQSQLFTSSVPGGTPPYTYQWYLNGAPVSGATNPTWTFTPTSAASYGVYLKVLDSASAVATSNTVSATVKGPLSITVAPSSATIGAGQSQLFTSTVSGGTSPFAYQWYLNGAAVLSATSSTWTFIPSSVGSYSIYVNVTDNAGFRAESNIATLTVTPVSATISPTSATLNVGQSQLFTSSVSGGASPYSYQWYLNSALVSGATSSSWTFTPSSAGSYTVYLKVSDSVGGQATSNTANVTANSVQISYALTMYTVGQGSVVPGNGTYSAGTNVNIQAIAAAGWLFARWSGGASGSSNTTIVMNSNTVVTATFTQTSYALTMYTVGQGSVVPGNGTYGAGASVGIQAITAAGWLFAGWSGSVTGLSNMTITVNGNMFVTATFSQLVAGHDVAVTNIASYKTSIGQGFSSNVTVTIGNLGSFAETFNVTVYANQTVIATFVNTALASGNSESLSFTWSTSGFAMGDYTISANAGNVNTTNNYLSSVPVAVTIIGDINGDFKVSLSDLVLLANAYGSKPGMANWNPNADIDGNGVVSLTDLVNLGLHYGQHFP